MTHLTLTLTLTDSSGIDGTVIATLWDDDTLYDFDIVPDGEFSPTWSQVERELESELYPMYNPSNY